MHRVAWTVLALVFLGAPSAALPSVLFELDGRLRWEAPAHANGAVTVIPDAAMGGMTSIAPRPGADLAQPLLLQGDRTEILIHRWTDAAMDPMGVGLPGVPDGPPVPLPRSHARLILEDLSSAPHILSLAGQGASPTAAPLADCRIDGAESGSVVRFPLDSTAAVPEHFGRRPVPVGSMVAACSAPSLDAAQASSAFFYGMTLRLESDEGGVERIPTGTNSGTGHPPRQGELTAETEQPAFFRMTTVLEVRSVPGSPMHTSYPFATDFRAYGGDVRIAGLLELARSHGRLSWNDQVYEGAIDPVSATGVFAVSRAEATKYAVRGETREAPQAVAQYATAPIQAPPTAWVLAAAGAGAAVFLAFLLWPLFSKLDAGRALDHPLRQQIFEHVVQEPGVEVNRVAERLGLGWTLVHYHTRRLAATGHLNVARIGGRIALFPANRGYRGRELQISLLRRGNARRVHELLTAEPGLDQATIAGRLPLAQSQVSRWLRKLDEAGLVRCEIEGSRRRYFPNPAST